ncbi:MAG: UDP-2,3-diacylglucosamine diphosphatase [Dysgonamonadaceae bacterium]|jgi:UDP-2,3-diacylglucosamine hydrolase|nr:UDP-2,3-diacylglucosamine diphosphatase [Dysgonamonadaceae bacterium]
MKKIYFASDMHFGSDAFEDPSITEKRFVRWLDVIKHDAGALYLLGDVFDFWYEYKYVIPRGFTRFLGKIAEMSDSGIEIHFFTGNHDVWIYDYLPSELGITLHKEPFLTELNGKKCYLAHGDGLGDHSRSFHFIRRIFHNKICQVLFSAIHPRWGIAFARIWSRYSRKTGLLNPEDYLGEDREYLVLFAKEYLKHHPEINYFIFGHRHILLDLSLSHESRVLILGDWLNYFSYAVLDGEQMSLEQFEE